MSDRTRPVPGQRGNSLDAESLDELLTAVLKLTAEVSALRERVSIWERVLASKGFPVTETPRRLVTADLQDPLLAAERKRLLCDAVESSRPSEMRGSG